MKSTLLWRLAPACLLLILSGSARAQDKLPDFSPLDKAAADELKAGQTPGAALAIVRGDRVVFARGFGVASVETGAPVTPDMLFRLGSTTKMFVSAALVMLAEDGKIRLDKPIGDYVRNLPGKVGRLTVHQLLTHTGGLSDESPMHGPADDGALGRGVRAFKDDVFFTEPGAIYSYSNMGYWIAGLVFEEVSGRPFADEMQRRVFAPLGMSRTTFRPTMAMTWPLAVGHQVQGKGPPTVVRPLADNAATWPAGQMFCNLADFARFAVAFMNDGQLDGKQVLSPSLIKALATGYVDTPHTGGKYGYGLGMRQARGIHFLGHGGSRLGYGSSLTLVPKDKLAVIALANRTGASLPKTVERALELLYPDAPKATPPPRKEIPMSADEAAQVAGTYSNHRQTIVLIAKDASLRTDKGARVVKVAPERFFVEAGKEPAHELFLATGRDGLRYLIRQGRAFKRA